MKKQKTVTQCSVILSTYNHFQYLPAAVESILSQTMKDFEFIIINDGSTDDTQEYLDTLSDMRIRFVVHKENCGIRPSYNEGIKMANGEYIAWISSDNIYLPNFLEKLTKALDDHPNIVFAYSAFYWMDSKYNITGRNEQVLLGHHSLILGSPGIASFMYRKSIHDELGYLFDIGVASDTDFWIRMSEKYSINRFIYIPDVLQYFMLDGTVDTMRQVKDGRMKISLDKLLDRVKERRRLTMKKPRILFVTHTFPPRSYTGTELYAYHLAKGLINDGFEVSVLHRETGQPKITQFEYEGIKVFNIWSDWDYRELSSHNNNQAMEQNFKSFLDGSTFDVIHFHHTMGLPFSIIEIAQKCGYPTCVSIHDFWYMCPFTFLVKTDGIVHQHAPSTVDECVKCVLRNEVGLTYGQLTGTHFHLANRKYYTKHIFSKVDIITCASKYVKRIYEEMYGVDEFTVELAPLGIVPFKRYELPHHDVLTFGFFGAIHPIKNIMMVINAFKNVLSDKIRLVIWGSGNKEYMDEMFRAVGSDSRIQYKGPYAPDDLPIVLGSMDISIHPSLNESYSLTVRESLMAGVPVIISEAEAYKEVSNHSSLYAPRFGDQVGLENIFRRLAEGGITTLLTMKESIPKIREIGVDVKEWGERYRGLLR